MNGDALELALGLYRAPNQRFALPGRPLPSDIDAVIQLAAGVQPKLRDAAASHGESEQTVLEAARFYLQQILFQPDADAYRVLGLRPDAEPERIHRHYRWLQSWLHPDRCDDEWEALLATRVNWAWGHLRSDAARRRYATADEAGANGSKETDSYPSFETNPSLRTNEWFPAQTASLSSVSWPKRIALGVSLGVCVGLLVLSVALRDAGVPDDFISPDTAQSGSLGRSLVEHAKQVIARTAKPGEDVAGTGQTVPDSPIPDPPVLAPALAAPESTIEQPQPPAVDAEVAQLPSPTISPPQVRLPVVADVRFSETTIEPVRPPTELADAASAPTPAAQKPARNTRAAKPPIASVNEERGDPTVRHQRVAPNALPATHAVGVAELAGSVPNPAETASNKTVSLQTTPVERSPVVPAPDLASPEETRARMDLARQRIGEVAAYLGNPRSQPPPVWNDVHGQLGAEQQRAALLQRSQSHAGGDFIVETAAWQISRNAVALNADYHLLRGRNVFESGRIAMDMVWREQMWLITRVELIPGQ